MSRLSWSSASKQEQLGADQVGDVLVDRRAEEDDPLLEQTLEDVGLSHVGKRAAHHGAASGRAGACGDHGGLDQAQLGRAEIRRRAFEGCRGSLGGGVLWGHPPEASVPPALTVARRSLSGRVRPRASAGKRGVKGTVNQYAGVAEWQTRRV